MFSSRKDVGVSLKQNKSNVPKKWFFFICSNVKDDKVSCLVTVNAVLPCDCTDVSISLEIFDFLISVSVLTS